MKKLLSLLLISILAFNFTGCGGTENKKEDTPKTEAKQETKNKESNVKMPEKEMGKGKIELSTPGGTSENGNVPALLVDKDAQIIQIGINAEEFEGSKLSYIFIDGRESTKEQLGDTQTSIDLKGDSLKVGKHKVEVVQFDNDKTDGKIITYKTVSYEVKSK